MDSRLLADFKTGGEYAPLQGGFEIPSHESQQAAEHPGLLAAAVSLKIDRRSMIEGLQKTLSLTPPLETAWRSCQT
jgi:hypothetical protein